MQNAATGTTPVKAVVLGGSKGIGRAIAQSLAAEGAQVAVGARHIEALRELQAQTRASNHAIHIGGCDVTKPASVERFILQAADDLDGIDALINCASSFSQINNEESWATAFNTDLMGSVRAVNAALPFLERSGRGAIVNMSSVGARQAAPDRLPYVAMKAAIEQYTASAARLYAQAGIRVNCVVVGSTDFPGSMWDRIRQTDAARWERTRGSIPLGSFATPENIADAVRFLISAQAGWITGQCIAVDGGQTAGR
jgi:NAD(P)-dependent dehydrogenase (short-subunit alcohol dehydrogenase family)